MEVRIGLLGFVSEPFPAGGDRAPGYSLQYTRWITNIGKINRLTFLEPIYHTIDRVGLLIVIIGILFTFGIRWANVL